MRILAIDDDMDALETLERVLSRAGHTVALSTNVKDGLAAIARVVPDVVIADVLMLDGGGIALIKTLRRRYPELWIVAVSGADRHMPASVSLAMAEAFGADRTLYKPFRGIDLLTAIVPE